MNSWSLFTLKYFNDLFLHSDSLLSGILALVDFCFYFHHLLLQIPDDLIFNKIALNTFIQRLDTT